MKKILVIISREFLTRIRKKSFILTTLLFPIVMVVLMMVPLYLDKHTEKTCTVYVLDDNNYFINKFHNTSKIKFEYPSGELEGLQKRCVDGECDAVLHILGGSQSNRANLFFYKDPPLNLKNGIAEQMDEVMFDRALQQEFNVDVQRYKIVKESSHSDIQTLQINEDGRIKEKSVEMNRVIGIICGILIYFFVFTYANQVMRSVIEEKSNRIIEVIVSSVKPFQFMMGKIVGVALAGLTQFVAQIAIIIFLLFSMGSFIPQLLSDDSTAEAIAQNGSDFAGATVASNNDVFASISSFYNIPFGTLIVCFLFFFIIGYLMYAALYAGVGSATDNETDSNQLVLPISIPLIISLIVIVSGISPQHELIRWLSFIPFTSPIAMLYRIPSGVPLWELLLSGGILLLTFLLCTAFAAKIYRIGLLTYGKKVSWRELMRWVRMR